MNLSSIRNNKSISDLLFILWAGGTALLSYSLVYALRKPFTAATFTDMTIWDMDYKVIVTIVQIVGYLVAKFMGIKLISELKSTYRLKFILGAIISAELALVGFAVLPVPFNVLAMFFNGLALGCMWGVIFSFIEGRRVTDLLASLLGVSMVVSSGTAKSLGLFVMDSLHVSEFWMPALIGACALPLLAFLGYALQCLPHPTDEDMVLKAERVTLNGRQRRGITWIVDAMSSFGGIPIDIKKLGIDFLVSSANKCIQGVPGFAFIIARREKLSECKGVARSLSLDVYTQWEEMEKGHGKWRFTSPTHVVRAFFQALKELKAEGGIEVRHRRYCKNHETLVEGMQKLGFRTLLESRMQSPIITSFLYPEKTFSFAGFYEKLKQEGVVIYPGKVSDADTFRIGTIGDVFPDDFDRLIKVIAGIRRRED